MIVFLIFKNFRISRNASYDRRKVKGCAVSTILCPDFTISQLMLNTRTLRCRIDAFAITLSGILRPLPSRMFMLGSVTGIRFTYRWFRSVLLRYQETQLMTSADVIASPHKTFLIPSTFSGGFSFLLSLCCFQKFL